MKVKNDHRSKFSDLSNWKEEARRNQGFNGIRARDLRDTGALLYQLSFFFELNKLTSNSMAVPKFSRKLERVSNFKKSIN